MLQLIKNRKDGVNLLWVVVSVVIISIVLVIISFIYFINSDSYETVKQISAATNSLEKDDLDGYDTTSPIQAKDLNIYSKTLNNRVNTFNDTDAFNIDIISEETLGY